ncbi:hypothetical protein [Actinomadura sp. 6N118]|uniref:hypothetical protein n=1 Tax=Actinomadura sp. 6N118 TaxID=3375151 RepID=UPI003795AFDE
MVGKISAMGIEHPDARVLDRRLARIRQRRREAEFIAIRRGDPWPTGDLEAIASRRLEDGQFRDSEMILCRCEADNPHARAADNPAVTRLLDMDDLRFRKVALGSRHRPYGTPCQHEHACIRCPMLRLDPAQVPRLLQIEDNTRERLQEARQMQWLGEVAALEESLRHIAEKKQKAERLRLRAS